MKSHSFFKRLTVLFFVVAFFIANSAFAESENELAARFSDAIGYAGKYALTEMRPTASFDTTSIEKIRQSDQAEGGDIKARVFVKWTTAFTGKNRTTVIDVWISVLENEVYLTRYKLYSDDHNIPILNSQDARVKVQLGSLTSNKKDNF